MRISTTMFGVLVLAIIFTLLRDEVGRVAVIVFGAGLGVTVGGVAAIMALFQTIGAFGEAQTWIAHIEALVATALVLVVGSAGMLVFMFLGAYLIRLAVP